MSMIDWTRPLRVKGTTAAAVVVGIDPTGAYPVRVRVDGHRGEFAATRDGRLHEAPFADLENVAAAGMDDAFVAELLATVAKLQGEGMANSAILTRLASM